MAIVAAIGIGKAQAPFEIKTTNKYSTILLVKVNSTKVQLHKINVN